MKENDGGVYIFLKIIEELDDWVLISTLLLYDSVLRTLSSPSLSGYCRCSPLDDKLMCHPDYNILFDVSISEHHIYIDTTIIVILGGEWHAKYLCVYKKHPA